MPLENAPHNTAVQFVARIWKATNEVNDIFENFLTRQKKKSMNLMLLWCNRSALTMILNVKMLSKNLLLKTKVSHEKYMV